MGIWYDHSGRCFFSFTYCIPFIGPSQEIISGKTPYVEVESDVSVLIKLKDRELPAIPSSSVAEVDLPQVTSDEIWWLCRECWNISPKSRPLMRIMAEHIHQTRARNMSPNN